MRYLTLVIGLLLMLGIPAQAAERTRAVSHYIVLTTVTAAQPMPMKRFEVAEKNAEGLYTGKVVKEPLANRYPKARRSLDGSLMIVGVELDNLYEAVDEFRAGFKTEDQFQILSHKEALVLMQTPEWKSKEVIQK